MVSITASITITCDGPFTGKPCPFQHVYTLTTDNASAVAFARQRAFDRDWARRTVAGVGVVDMCPQCDLVHQLKMPAPEVSW